jgi:hypothetical protein
VPFVLHTASAVRLRLFDLQGRQGAEIDAGKLGVGEQQIVVNMKQLGLPTSTYAYQLDVENNNGKFHSSRLMTAL